MNPAQRTGALWAPAACLVAGAAVAGAGAADDGARAAGSALLGVLVVVGFLGSGAVPLLLVRRHEGSAALGLGVLLLNYSFRLVVAVLVLTLVAQSAVFEVQWTGLAVVAGALAWAAGQAVAVLRPVHDPAGHGDPPQDR